MHEHIQKKTQEFRELKTDVKVEVMKENEAILDEKRQDVMKQREIKKIIKTEQKTELDRNIQVFLHLNKEEKGLRRELCDKQVELQYKEKYLKRVNVRHQHKALQMKKEERDKFVGSFAQAKNLIEKQMKLGNMIRDKKAQVAVNRKKVQGIKKEKEQEDHRVVLRNQLYGNSALEISTQRSSMVPGSHSKFLSQSQY
mmetsp:Transcript_17748/g.27433  ORF Transcript_17748/g.27433 Transcript_17748/m.27433 type:complete len:198 (+) Transcript_17748:1054-1647(+)